MAAPSYTPVSPGSRLYASTAMPDGGFAGYWCSAGASLGSPAALTQCWADQGGFFLFATHMPADPVVFAQIIGQLAARWSPSGLTRLVWVQNDPALGWGYWQSQCLTALPRSAPSGAWQVVRPLSLQLGNYQVSVAAGCSLGLSAQDGHIQLARKSVAFSYVYTALPANGDCYISLGDGAIGAVVVPVLLTAQQQNLDQQLGVCLRYATTPDQDDPQAVQDNLARTLSMPVLRLGQGNMTVSLSYDPCAPLNPDRTFLSLLQVSGVPVSLKSAFSTTYGYDINLAPATAAAGCRSARLVFCRSPVYALDEGDFGVQSYYLAPEGRFYAQVQVPYGVQQRRTALLAAQQPSEQDHWMFGTAGSEYAALDSSSQSWVVFSSGAAAWVPDSPAANQPVLTLGATTSYMTLVGSQSAADGLSYFAQPLQAPLFLGSGGLGNGFLNFYPMVSGSLPSQGQLAQTGKYAPVGAYRWLDNDQVELAGQLETAILAPVRRSVIGGVAQQSTGKADVQTTAPLATTPQGLLARLNTAGTAWAEVLFANLPGSGQQLGFTPVGADFAQALQSNQLFFVVSDPAAFLLQSGAGGSGLDCTLDGWTFRLNPQNWRKPPLSNTTVMLFKFCNRSLVDLVDDAGAWGWSAMAAPLSQSQAQLQAILADAAERAKILPAYKQFYDEVANNPLWNGVLFLNAPLDLGQMPDDLKFLAAGIDPTRFYAHHVGFSVTPIQVDQGMAVPGQTAAFALIDYQDPQSLSADSTVPYGFKTTKLQIRFANAQIADFSAQCQLMLNLLLGAPLTKQDVEYGNNLVMDGTCQRVAGVPSYSFVLNGQNLFNASASALASSEILAVRIETASASQGDLVSASFTLSGNLRFRLWQDFDLFSYGTTDSGSDGYLRFGGLTIRMSFDIKTPQAQSFSAAESAMSLDTSTSLPRPRSVAANFPLRLVGVVVTPHDDQGQAQTPDQQGYVSISCPLDQSPLSAPWYGLLFDVDLGSLGALSGGIGLSMGVLAAWSPGVGSDGPPLYVGLKMASFVPGAGNLPLQGVLKLGFRGFDFISYDAGNDMTGYQLWMRRFALSVLCWSFPPGNADLVLFGDPGDPTGTLGWYAAYDGQPDQASLSGPDAADLRLSTPPSNREQANSRRVIPVA